MGQKAADQEVEDQEVADLKVEVSRSEAAEGPMGFPESMARLQSGKAAGRSGCRLIQEAAAAQQSLS